MSRHRKEQQRLSLQSGPILQNGYLPNSDSYRTETESKGSDADVPHGKIEISPKAISHLASRIAQQSYGVVGLASRHAHPGLAELLHLEEQDKGVQVSFSGDTVIIDLYVIIEYGTRISEVARNIMSSVKYSVESALDVANVQVNVNVQGIRVSDETG